jgi:hypothetical protein
MNCRSAVALVVIVLGSVVACGSTDPNVNSNSGIHPANSAAVGVAGGTRATSGSYVLITNNGDAPGASAVPSSAHYKLYSGFIGSVIQKQH